MDGLIDELAARGSVVLQSQQHARLSQYLDLLLAANQRMNLTRITERGAAEVQHLGDSLTLLPFLPAGAIRVVDVGSGGGVPGIPLAIARPDAAFVLIESTKKKAAFLTEAIGQLGLTNVTISDWRAEQVGQSNSRESFDIAIVRAVATMNWLAEWCLPLVKKNGRMLAMKGPKVVDELPLPARALKQLGGGEPIIHAVNLPGTEHRVIVEILKIGKTDKWYPRDPTSAKGKPIA